MNEFEQYLTEEEPEATEDILGGVLAGKEKSFIQAGERHGIDPKFLMSVSMFETGNGTSRMARQQNNVAGITNPGGRSYRTFDSIDDSIEYMASNLKRNYIDKGLTTIDQIAAKYAPIGAANDPNQTNNQWPSAVGRNYAQLSGEQIRQRIQRTTPERAMIAGEPTTAAEEATLPEVSAGNEFADLLKPKPEAEIGEENEFSKYLVAEPPVPLSTEEAAPVTIPEEQRKPTEPISVEDILGEPEKPAPAAKVRTPPIPSAPRPIPPLQPLPELQTTEIPPPDLTAPGMAGGIGQVIGGQIPPPQIPQIPQEELPLGVAQTESGLLNLRTGVVTPGPVPAAAETLQGFQEPLVPPEYFPPYWLARGAEAVLPEHPIKDVYVGELKGVADMISGFTAPGNLALLGAGGIGLVARRLVAGGFSGLAATQAPAAWKAFNETDDLEEKTRIAVGTIAGIGLPLLGMKGGKRVKAQKQVQKAVQEVIGQRSLYTTGERGFVTYSPRGAAEVSPEPPPVPIEIRPSAPSLIPPEAPPPVAPSTQEIPYSGGMTFTEELNILANQARKRPLKPKRQIETVTGIRSSIEPLRNELVTRKDAFIERLRGMEQAARGAAKATRDTLRIADKWLEADREAIARKLIGFAERHLPLAERAKFMRQIKNATRRLPLLSKNPARMYNKADDVLNAMTERVYDVKRKQLIQDTNRLLARVEASPSITVTMKTAIRDQARIFNNLKDKMSVTMLEAKLARLVQLENRGRNVFALNRAVEEVRAIRSLNEIIAQGTATVNAVPELERAFGEATRYWDDKLNLFHKIPSIMKNFNMHTTPMDWLFTVFDRRFEGAMYRTMKLPYDIKYSEYLSLRDAYKARLSQIETKYKLHDGNMERIGVHAELRQTGGYENLKAKGYSDAELNSALNLTKPERAWLREADKILNETLEFATPVLRDFYNTEIQKVPNYFPRQRDWDWYNSLSIEEGRFARAFNRTNTESGMFVKREPGAVTKNITDAHQIMFNHIDDVLYHSLLGPEIKRVGNIVRSREFQAQTGTRGQEVFADWVDVIARDGGVGAANRLRGFANTLIKNVGVGQLAWRLTTIGLQPLSLIQGMGLTSPKNVGIALSRVASSRNRNWILNNFPEIKYRVGDDPAYGVYRGRGVRDTLGRKGYEPIVTMDRFAAMATGEAAYRDNLASRGLPFDMAQPDREAIAYAQRIVRMTQSSAYAKDVPLAISHGNLFGNKAGNVTINKAMFQFQNFIVNRWAYLKHAGLQMGIEEKNPVQAGRIMAFLLLGTMAEQMSRDGIKRGIRAVLGSTPQDEREQAKGKAYATQMASKTAVDFLTSAPGITNVSGAIRYGGSGVPAIDVLLIDPLTAARTIVTGKKPVTRATGGVRLAQSAGAAVGLPTGQLGDIAVHAMRANMRDYHRSTNHLFYLPPSQALVLPPPAPLPPVSVQP